MNQKGLVNQMLPKLFILYRMNYQVTQCQMSLQTKNQNIRELHQSTYNILVMTFLRVYTVCLKQMRMVRKCFPLRYGNHAVFLEYPFMHYIFERLKYKNKKMGKGCAVSKTDTTRALNKNLFRFSIQTYIYFLQTSLEGKAVNPLCYTHILQNVLNREKRILVVCKKYKLQIQFRCAD